MIGRLARGLPLTPGILGPAHSGHGLQVWRATYKRPAGGYTLGAHTLGPRTLLWRISHTVPSEAYTLGPTLSDLGVAEGRADA